MRIKKVTAFLLVLCLMAAVLPGKAFAAGETSGDWENIHWEYDTASATLTITGEGDMPEASAYWEYPYHNIAAEFAKKLVIGAGITSISNHAFFLFNKLQDVSILGQVRLIDENAFAHCYSLQSIVIPGCVEEVGEYAFHTCLKLDSVTISEGVKIFNTLLKSLASWTPPTRKRS